MNFDLYNKNEQLVCQQKDLYKQMKIDEYSFCNHIWVNTLHDYDSFEGRSYNYHGCIKCGLDQRVFYLSEQYRDLDLAKAIYSKIKEAHPDIDDETARKYFEIVLYNIRENKVSDERKAKRLSLSPEFNKWTGCY